MIIVKDLAGIANKNGIIWNLSFEPTQHVAVIECKAGTSRSNHFHKTSSHWLYVVSGGMVYSERDCGSQDREMVYVNPGQMVYTGPNKVHRCDFNVDTVLVSLTNNTSQAAHEGDLVREEF